MNRISGLNASIGSQYGSTVSSAFWRLYLELGSAILLFKIGFIYIFNLIVGTGALTMPKAFFNSGWLLSSLLIVFLTFMSYATATFMFEAMAITNAIKRYTSKEEEMPSDSVVNRNFKARSSSSKNNLFMASSTTISDLANVNDSQADIVDDNAPATLNINYESEDLDRIVPAETQEHTPLMSNSNSMADDDLYLINNTDDDGTSRQDLKRINKLYEIKVKYEMGEMAAMFFNKTGLVLFYMAMILYLYGDLAIYDAAVPKSLRDTTCTFYRNSTNQTVKLTEQDPCWSSAPSLSRFSVYRIYVVCFNLLIGSLVFYNVQKTKFLQLCTTIMRWVAFITMIVLALRHIIDNKNQNKPSPEVKLFNVKGLPNFFGVCIYAFMCHHSLPSIITPIKSKRRFIYMLLLAYVCILVFYLLLSFTGLFAFGPKLDDFYTLNFEPAHDSSDSLLLKVIKYYLSLFPVFTISASFPIIAITLRNNLLGLHQLIKKNSVQDSKTFFLFPLITLIPPLIISLITHDLQLLVGITGSYAGVCIQYIFPACLVYFGRREAIRCFHNNYQLKQQYRSPFSSRYWVFGILLWANVSVIFVTINHIVTGS